MNEITVKIPVYDGLVKLASCVSPILTEIKSAVLSKIHNVSEMDRAHGLQ
jgi:hypothetical protein